MNTLKAITLSMLFFTCNITYAGIYTDDLSRCLVESSSPQDKLSFVRWMFTAMSLHPAVNDMSNLKEADRSAANKKMAELMINLVSEKCIEQSKKAIKFEGQLAMQSSFQVFGQIAGQELFSHPAVAAGLADLEKHIDRKKLNERLGISQK